MSEKCNYKTMVSFPIDILLVEQVDIWSAENNISRAAYIREAIKEKLARDKK